MPTLDAYSKDEFEIARIELIEDLLYSSQPSPQEQPRAYLLGGQSGAGKTTLHQVLRRRFDNNLIVINGDEYRSRHPRYQELDALHGPEAVSYTAAWSGAMTEALIEAFSSMHYNLVIEGTLRTSDVPLKTAALLRAKGYSTGLALMAVKPEVSLISCQIRYEQMRIAGTVPRATDPAHHKLIVGAIVDNLAVLEESGMFDEVLLFNRSRECLYPLVGGNSSHLSSASNSASEALREILFGEWTPQEEEHYAKLQELLQVLQGTSR